MNQEMRLTGKGKGWGKRVCDGIREQDGIRECANLDFKKKKKKKTKRKGKTGTARFAFNWIT
jgi:hypothetical protein